MEFFLKPKRKLEDTTFEFSIENESRTLHCAFGHHSLKSLEKLLHCADSLSFDTKIVNSHDNVRHVCGKRAVFEFSSRRLKSNVRCEELRFDHRVNLIPCFLLVVLPATWSTKPETSVAPLSLQPFNKKVSNCIKNVPSFLLNLPFVLYL